MHMHFGVLHADRPPISGPLYKLHVFPEGTFAQFGGSVGRSVGRSVGGVPGPSIAPLPRPSSNGLMAIHRTEVRTAQPHPQLHRRTEGVEGCSAVPEHIPATAFACSCLGYLRSPKRGRARSCLCACARASVRRADLCGRVSFAWHIPSQRETAWPWGHTLMARVWGLKVLAWGKHCVGRASLAKAWKSGAGVSGCDPKDSVVGEFQGRGGCCGKMKDGTNHCRT